MASGPTTTGLAALIVGEDWVYVGSGGDAPAFDPDFANLTGAAAMSFQMRATGEVRLFGVVERVATAGSAIFVLPASYRPMNATAPVNVVRDRGGTLAAQTLLIDTSGVVTLGGNTGDLLYINGSYPVNTPAAA